MTLIEVVVVVIAMIVMMISESMVTLNRRWESRRYVSGLKRRQRPKWGAARRVQST